MRGEEGKKMYSKTLFRFQISKTYFTKCTCNLSYHNFPEHCFPRIMQNQDRNAVSSAYSTADSAVGAMKNVGLPNNKGIKKLTTTKKKSLQ